MSLSSMNAVSSVATAGQAYSKELPTTAPVAAHSDPVTISDASKKAFQEAQEKADVPTQH